MSHDVSSTISSPRRTVSIDCRLSRFRLPPVESALIIGKRAHIGPKAIEKALQEMLPGGFERIDVTHPVIESILVNVSHLRRVPREKLIAFLIRHSEGAMESDDTLHVALEIELVIKEQLEL